MPAGPRKKKVHLRSKPRKKRRVNVMLPALLLFISCFLLGGGIFYKKVSTVFVSAQEEGISFGSESSLFTVLFISLNDFADKSPSIKNIELAVLNRGDNTLYIINIPNSQSMDVPGKYGVEKLSSVYAFGLSVYDDRFKAMDLVKKTVENDSQMSVNRIVVSNEDTQKELIALLKDPSYLSLSSTALKFALNGPQGDLLTDLTDNDSYNIIKFINEDISVRSAKYAEWGRVSSEVSYSSDLADERLSIAVLNGFGEEGAGKQAADVISTSGGRVTFLGNAKNAYEQSLIVTNDPNSKTVLYLKDFFNIEKIETRFKYSFIEPDAERADVTVILGIDFKKVIY